MQKRLQNNLLWLAAIANTSSQQGIDNDRYKKKTSK